MSAKRPRTKKRPSSPELKSSESPPMISGALTSSKCVNSDCSRERPPMRVFCDVCLRKSQQKYGGAPDERLWAIKRVSQEQSKINPMFCDCMRQSETGQTVFDHPFSSYIILFGAIEKVVSDQDHEVIRRPVCPKVVLKDAFSRVVSEPYLEPNHGLFAYFFDATKFAWPLQLEFSDSVTEDQLYRLLELDDIFTERVQIELSHEALRNVGRLAVPTVFAKADELRMRFKLAAEMLSKVKEVARELESASDNFLGDRRDAKRIQQNPIVVPSVVDELDRKMWRMVLNECKNELQSVVAGKHKLNCLRELLIATQGPSNFDLSISGYEAEGAELAQAKVTCDALCNVLLKISTDKPAYVYVFQEDEDISLLTDDDLREPNCAPGDELLCCPVNISCNDRLPTVTFHAFAFSEPLDEYNPALLCGFRAISLANLEPVTNRSSLANVAIEAKAHVKFTVAMAAKDAFA